MAGEFTREEIMQFFRDEVRKYCKNGVQELSFGREDHIEEKTLMAAFNEYCNDEQLLHDFLTFEDYLYERIEHDKNYGITWIAREQLMDCIQRDAFFREDGESFGYAIEDIFEDEGMLPLYEVGYKGVSYAVADMLQHDYRLNLMFTTEEEDNHSNIMDFYSAFLPEKGTIENAFESAKEFGEHGDNALTHLIHQQGYSVKDVADCMHSGESCQSRFIQSVAAEIQSTSTALQKASAYRSFELTVCVSASGQNLLDVLNQAAHGRDNIYGRGNMGRGNMKVSEESRMGLFDRMHGDYIPLFPEKQVILPAWMISNVQIEGAGRQNTQSGKLHNDFTVGEKYPEIWKDIAAMTEDIPGIVATKEEPVLLQEDFHELYAELCEQNREVEHGDD